ncbi:hypothetical protein KI688_009513 [Linnemannia hyalina]|uniref:Uncharacterized protein n=1 Tax=Linnemannia hyalina TaxID=64524 RepID=A0A9P8BWG6_9FUNG|nr:hypothetical protein KI688_009513 [Linnemannia hyalina]
MDPPTPHRGNAQSPKSRNDDVTSGCWRQFSKPANYAEDYNGGMGRTLEPLRRSRIPRKHNSASLITPTSPLPLVPSNNPLTLNSPERIAISSDYIPLSPQTPPFFAPSTQQNFTESSLVESPATEKSSLTYISLAKSTISNGQDSSPSVDIGGSNSTLNGSAVSIENNVSTSSSSSQSSTPGQPSDNNETSNSGDGSGTTLEAGSGSAGTPKKPRPSVPRIIIPDGTSINLSTPPTTPRQSYRTPLPVVMVHWPYTLQQIKEKLRSQGRLPYRRNQVAPLRQAVDPGNNTADQRQKSTQQTPRATGQADVQIELAELSPAEGRESFPEVNSALDDPSSPEQLPRLPHMSEFGVMGFQTGGRNDSMSSSDKFIWWDYEESSEGFFSRERWRRALCSRPGLVNLCKHIVATSLGLITILALALTALGRIKNHQQVSDTIPESLADNIMESQIVVIKDFNRLQQANLAQGNYAQLEQQPQVKTTSKIPIWTQPIRQGCFHEKCDIKDLSKEYFAFMNPESFGIALPHNWPSLCNSCIEISRNQFVYKTKVRILGDLSTCSVDATQPNGSVVPSPVSSTPASTSQSISATLPSNPVHKTHRHKPKRLGTIPDLYPHSRENKAQKRQEAGAHPLVQDPAVATLPYLIVDPSTFNNLTMYDTQAALHDMVLLPVQFRFVVCES